MDLRSRASRAWADTHGIREWKPGVSSALFAGAAVFVGRAVTDSFESAVSEGWIVVLSMAGAFFVRPAVEFLWNYLWTPWRVVQEQVAAIYARQRGETRERPINPELELRNVARKLSDISDRAKRIQRWSSEEDRKVDDLVDTATQLLIEQDLDAHARRFIQACQQAGTGGAPATASKATALEDIADAVADEGE